MIVVFDLDGTLVDASELHATILSEILEKKIDPKIIYNSSSLHFLVMENTPRDKWASIKDVTRQHEAKMLENVNLVKPMPGVYEVLTEIKYKKALFTSASKRLTTAILKELNLNGYFDIIITQTDVVRSKPDSEGLYIIESKLNDDELIVIGNSGKDMLAAKKIGAISILFSKEKKRANVADYTVSSLKELPYLVKSLKK
ncbi:MAG: HAD family hydrolase [Candidatus Altiarchaeota archaeon]|nr:HAD family hydrolase [Candidatus Altiarchaeota archaeon]